MVQINWYKVNSFLWIKGVETIFHETWISGIQSLPLVSSYDDSLWQQVLRANKWLSELTTDPLYSVNMQCHWLSKKQWNKKVFLLKSTLMFTALSFKSLEADDEDTDIAINGHCIHSVKKKTCRNEIIIINTNDPNQLPRFTTFNETTQLMFS